MSSLSSGWPAWTESAAPQISLIKIRIYFRSFGGESGLRFSLALFDRLSLHHAAPAAQKTSLLSLRSRLSLDRKNSRCIFLKFWLTTYYMQCRILVYQENWAGNACETRCAARELS